MHGLTRMRTGRHPQKGNHLVVRVIHVGDRNHPRFSSSCVRKIVDQRKMGRRCPASTSSQPPRNTRAADAPGPNASIAAAHMPSARVSRSRRSMARVQRAFWVRPSAFESGPLGRDQAPGSRRTAVTRHEGLVLESRGITASKWSEETKIVGASHCRFGSARVADDARTLGAPSCNRVRASVMPLSLWSRGLIALWAALQPLL